MNWIKTLTRRKFNYIDLVISTGGGLLLANHQYLAFAGVMLIGGTLSVLAERNFGS